MRHLVLPLAMVCAAAGAWGAGEQEASPVPVGVTDLLANPNRTVGYQYDGQEPRILGWQWQGFDAVSGVYFVPETDADTGLQVFMHCPWRGGPGVAFADYRLALVKNPRLRLLVSTALRASAAGSDGVTFRVAVDGRKLWESHCTWRKWREFEVDLSPYAGRTVTLRLEVDPGPERQTTDDWSLWGKAEIVAGTDAEVRAARERLEAQRREQRRREFAAAAQLARADLAPLARGDVDTACPSTAEPVRNRLELDGEEYVLSCEGRTERLEYRLNPQLGLLKGLAVVTTEGPLSPAPFVGGPRVLLGSQEFTAQSPSLTARLLSSEIEDGALVCRWEYSAEGVADVAVLTARLRAEGKSLALRLEGPAGRFAGFQVLASAGSDMPAPFSTGWRRYLPQGYYTSAFADVWQSDASGVGGASAQTTYSALTDGTRRALRDTFYLTVSRRYDEVLPNIPTRPSPYLGDLAHRVVLDAWGGSFAENEQWLRDMARYGVDSFLIIKHVWQRDGYDHTYPNVMPANAAMGGDEALRSLSLAAQELGHLFCVHENFYDYYPNAEAFREEDCALTPDGNTIPGWDNGSVRAVILKPSKLMDYAHRFTPEVKQRYSCNAAYHDIMPTWYVDYDARVENSGIVRQTHEYTRELCDYDRELFGGPVVFEAADPRLAGVYDGGSNHGRGTYRTPPAVAFELLKVHPKMSNHGFGYYERWLPWGYGSGWGHYVMTNRELDKYRATQVAFGRTGFIGQQLMKHPHGVVREYHLMQAFARAYTGRELRGLAYYVDDGVWQGWVDAGTAARHQQWQRLRATYEGGQEVYVNLSEESWRVAGHTLPAHACLTTGPRGTAYTALVDGQVADYAAYDDVMYADARSHQWSVPQPPAPVPPSLGEWKDNGDGTFDLTVNWRPERALDRDWTIFWHFKSGALILFQSDHKPSRPTSSWRVGETVADGPYRVQVRRDQQELEYDVYVGLYGEGDRAPLVQGSDQVRVATLEVTREGDRVTKIELRPAGAELAPGADPAPYLEGANRDKRVLDFGPVATNGAVVVRKVQGGLEVVPVPIGEEMRVGLAGKAGGVEAYDADGKTLGTLETRHEKGKTWFALPAAAARVVLRR